MSKRIALPGFSIECNRFAPVTTEHDFAIRTLVRGASMLRESRAAAPRMLSELPGFVADIAHIDACIGYRTNPHTDMRERGAESAQVLRRVMAGERMHVAKVRVPIVPPTEASRSQR